MNAPAFDLVDDGNGDVVVAGCDVVGDDGKEPVVGDDGKALAEVFVAAVE